MARLEEGRERTLDLRVLGRLWAYVVAHRGMLVGAAITLPFLAGAQLLGPYLLRLAIDRHIAPAVDGNAGALSGLWLLIGAFLAVQVGEMVLRFVQIYLMQVGGQRIMHDLRMAVFEHVQRLPMSFFDRNPIGRIMTRVTSDVETLNELVSQGIVAMARDVVSLIGIIAVMLWIDWRLSLASFVVFPLLMVIISFLRRRLRETYDLSRTLVARLNAFLQETISGMEVVQAFSQEERNRDEFRELRGELLGVDLRGVSYSSYLSAAVQAATTLATALVLSYGGFGIIGQTVTIGILVQFLEYLRRFYGPLEDLSDKYDTLQRAAAAAKKIFSLLDVRPAIRNRPNVSAPGPLRDAIRFEDVTFAYEEDGEPVVHSLSLTVNRGEKVALVGATGAGKSSVIKLLQRLYEPSSGRITIDGVDIRDLDVQALRRFFGTVPQDVFLFTDTIAANVALDEHTVGRDAVEEAVDVVEGRELVAELPRGLDTRLGERGANLSFGERQLLAFARALATEPEVLVLDEATASVDSETEARIQRALHRLVEDRTALIIAHRLSTIREVDRIVVLHRGEVREEGTHEQLLARGGLYATLYRLQYQQTAGSAEATGS